MKMALVDLPMDGQNLLLRRYSIYCELKTSGTGIGACKWDQKADVTFTHPARPTIAGIDQLCRRIEQAIPRSSVAAPWSECVPALEANQILYRDTRFIVDGTGACDITVDGLVGVIAISRYCSFGVVFDESSSSIQKTKDMKVRLKTSPLLHLADALGPG